MSGEEHELDLGVREVTRELAPFGTRGLAAGLAAFAASCGIPLAVSALGFPSLMPFALMAWLVAMVAWLFWVGGRSRAVRVAVSREGLRLGERERVPRGRVLGGFFAPAAQGVAAGLELTGGESWLVACASRAEAEAVLATLGADPSRRRLQVKRTRAFHRILALLFAPLTAMAGVAVTVGALRGAGVELPAAAAVALFALYAMAVAMLHPRLDVTLGRDGLASRRLLGARFFRWSDVADVRAGQGELVVELRGGRTERLWCNPDEAWVLPALVERAREELALARRAEDGGDTALAALDRGGRSFDAWRADLAALARTPGGYRDQAVTHERLRAVLADPATDPERRIGAALALAACEEPDAPGDGRARVRVAAETSADPALRAALESIAAGDGREDLVDDALERAQA